MHVEHTALRKQSRVPLYNFGLFIILVFTTSAGVLMVAAINPAQPLKNGEKTIKESKKKWKESLFKVPL